MAKDIIFYNNHALNDDLIINHDDSISFGEKQLSHHHVVNLPCFSFLMSDRNLNNFSSVVNILCLTKKCLRNVKFIPYCQKTNQSRRKFVERKDVYDGTPKELFVLLLKVFCISFQFQINLEFDGTSKHFHLNIVPSCNQGCVSSQYSVMINVTFRFYCNCLGQSVRSWNRKSSFMTIT